MKNIVLVVALLFAGACALPASVSATGSTAPIELEGFAWSPNAGWISMNCANDGLSGCTTSDYRVYIETDGSVKGWAWSSILGWILFDATGPYPSGLSTFGDSVGAVGTYPNLALRGWARACAGAADDFTCSGGMKANTGGWDGWISFSGSESTTGGSYGVTFVNGEATANSFAWGGPITMGWIDFSPDASSGPAIPPVSLVPTVDITIPSVSFTPGIPDLGGYYDAVAFSPTILGIPLGETVNWTITVGGLTANGTVTQTSSGPDFSPVPSLASVPFNVTDPLVFEVDMPEPGAVRETNETNVFVDNLFSLPLPPPTMSITGPEVVRAGETAEVSWEVSAPYPVTCTVQGPGINETLIIAGSLGSPDPQSGTRASAPLQNASTFVVSCVVGSDTYTETYEVEVIPTFQEI